MSSVFASASSLYQQVVRSASPKRMTVLVVIVLGLLAMMAWTQVKDKEQYLIQRNFRLLDLWGNDISLKIASYQKVLKTTLDGAIVDLSHDRDHSKITKEKGTGRTRLIRRPISKAEGSTTTLSTLLRFSGKCHERFATAQHKTQDKSEEFLDLKRLDLKREFLRLCEAEGLEEVGVKKVKNFAGERGLKILTRQSPPTIQLTYTNTDIPFYSPEKKDFPLKTKTQLTENRPWVISPKSGQNFENPAQTPIAAIEVRGIINLQTFLDRLWRHQIYDEILLFEKQDPEKEKSQSLIYHSGTSGMPWQSFQELKKYRESENFWGTSLASKELSTEENAASLQDRHFTISIPGQDFQVFTQPIIFPSNEKQQWVLVGLVQQEKFLNSSLAISSTLLLGMMFLLLGLVLAIPLFHLKTMGSKASLRSVHVLGLVLSALLGAGFVTFLILDISIYLHGKSDLEDSMTKSAQSIKGEMFGELKSILTTLRTFDFSTNLQNDFALIHNKTSFRNTSDTRTSSTEDLPIKIYEETLPVGQRPVLLEEKMDIKNVATPAAIEKSSDLYSDFLYAFWMDPDGSLRINWARDKFEKKPVHGMTQNFSLHKRDYVRRVIDSPDGLWKFPDEDSIAPFFLQPIISWTTGLNTVVASMRSNAITPTGTEPSKPWVAAIEFKFKSLMDQIILPPGIGFAVIDNVDHQVLFHSEEWRNLREPFLVETDDNPMLQDLLSAKTSGHAKGSYWGKPHSFFLLPLDPIPWSLVVFRDMEMLRSVNLVGLLIAGFLYSLWTFSIYLALWIFLRLQARHRRAPWLWPDINKRRIFAKLCVANVVVFVAQVIWIITFFDQRTWQLMWAWIIPFVWVVYSVRKGLKQQSLSSIEEDNKTTRIANWFSRWPYPQSYSLMLTTFLLILGVAPAFGCFSAVFNQEMRLFSQFQVLELAKDLFASEKSAPLLTSLKQKDSSGKKDNWKFNNIHLGVYPEFYSEITPRYQSTDAAGWKKAFKERTIFQKAFAVMSQPFSPLIKHAALLGFIADTRPATTEAESPGNTPPILWEPDGRKVKLQYLITEHKENGKELSIQLSILSFEADIPFTPWYLKEFFSSLESENILTLFSMPFEKYLSYGLLAGICIVILYFYLYTIPKFIADRVLFLSYTPPTSLPTSSLFSNTNKAMNHNRVVIGFPGQGKSHRAKKESTLHTFDLKTASPQSCCLSIENILNNESDKKSIHFIIDHFDHQWKDTKQNIEKLRLLERLYQEHWNVEEPKEKPKKVRMEVRG